MRNHWSCHTFTKILGGPWVCVLASLLSSACTSTDDGSGGNAPTAGSSTVGGAPSATGGIGAESGTPVGSTGGGTETSGGTGNDLTTGTGGSTGGGTATGGSGTGGLGGGTSTGGVSATGGTGTGGVGTETGGGATGGVGGTTAESSAGGTAAGGSSSGVGTGGDAAGGASAVGGTTGDTAAGGMSAMGGNTGGTATGEVGGTAGSGTGGTGDTVTRTDSTFTFHHFPIETNGVDVWSGPSSPAEQPTSTTYDTVVLENGYLRVTLLPDYGGRILSILHKPTGRELLYQNPLGTPYLMFEGIFYYDYLVIMGGIFPSFPEPEHGRYWNQPYDLEIVSETTEAITVRMSRQDDTDLAQGVPEKYDVGRTDVLVELEVTLRAGSASLELDTKLTNTRSSAISNFEYWTVTTLAPGSTPGETAIPLNTRIMAKMDQVHLLESSWSWFGSAEERVSDEVFRWNNLSYFENWVDQGTAFANPSYEANWSGLLNCDDDIGILRVSDNAETPGLKLWTFGKGSLDIDINDSTQWLRPTIEMWHGVTPEFWTRGTMAAGEVRQWSDRYFATLGLREVTAASEYGALNLSQSQAGADTVLSVAATLTLPNQPVTAILRLNGNVVAEENVIVAAAGPTTVEATVPSSEVSAGAAFEAEFRLGDRILLSGQIALP